MAAEDHQAEYWGFFDKLSRVASPPTEDARLDRLLRAALQDLISPGSSIEFDAHMALAASFKGPVLLSGSGSERLLTRLVQRGHAVACLTGSPQESEALSDLLTGLPDPTTDRVRLLQSDAGTLESTEKFSLMLIEDFAALAGPRNLFRFVENAGERLAEGGCLALGFLPFSDKDVESLDGRLHCAEVPSSYGPLMTVTGVKFMADRSRYRWNACAYQLRDGGTAQRRLAAATFRRIHEGELEAMLYEAGFVVAERHEMPLALLDRPITRLLYACVRRTSVGYPLWHPYSAMNDAEKQVTVLASGEGCRVRDSAGKEYLDAAAGLWNTQCGLGHRDIVEAIHRQLCRLSYGTLFALRSNEPAVELSRKLVELAPAPLTRVYLTCSGSESVELSIKLSRLYFDLRGQTRKKEVIYLDESYHGTYYGSMGVSGLYVGKHRLGPNLPGLAAVTAPSPNRCPPGQDYVAFSLQCAEELERRIAESGGGVAAFIIEPVLGSAGVVIPPREYFDAVQQICREHDVLLIVDEVATGFGRTGRWFASEHFGLRPDVLLLSKGINSGYLPLGAVMFKEQIARTLLRHNQGIGHGSTGNGNPVCCAAALATIEVIEREGLIGRAASNGEYLLERLRSLRSHPCVGDVRGLGLMCGMELVRRGKAGATPLSTQEIVAVYEAMLDGGILLYPFETGLTFCPALVITRQEVDAIVDRLDDCLSRVDSQGLRDTAPAAAGHPRLSDLS